MRDAPMIALAANIRLSKLTTAMTARLSDCRDTDPDEARRLERWLVDLGFACADLDRAARFDPDTLLDAHEHVERAERLLMGLAAEDWSASAWVRQRYGTCLEAVRSALGCLDGRRSAEVIRPERWARGRTQPLQLMGPGGPDAPGAA